MDLADPRLTRLAFIVRPIARELAHELKDDGQVEADVIRTVAARITTIEAGLSPELEFIAAINWLGRAAIANRVDQTPLPKYRDADPNFKVPDVLCIASLENGRSVPLLIEVKKSTQDPIVWTDKYLNGMKAYAEALHIPLLLAWKHHHFWTLTDVLHFEKKVDSHHLSFERACRENLMSSIFGDLMIVLTQRITFFIDAEVSANGELPAMPALLPEGAYTFTIRGAGFLLDGNPIELRSELAWLLFRAPTESEVTRTSQNTVRILYSPEAESMFSLMDFALMLMLWNEGETPDWEMVVREKIGVAADEVRKHLLAGIDLGVVRYILEQQPHTIPEFLRK